MKKTNLSCPVCFFFFFFLAKSPLLDFWLDFKCIFPPLPYFSVFYVEDVLCNICYYFTYSYAFLVITYSPEVSWKFAVQFLKFMNWNFLRDLCHEVGRPLYFLRFSRIISMNVLIIPAFKLGILEQRTRTYCNSNLPSS